jgi:hypothetical protein
VIILFMGGRDGGRFKDKPGRAVYVIGVACKLVKIPVWTLRQLDKAGIVRPKRSGRKNRPVFF